MSTADDLAYLKAQRAVVAAQLERVPAEHRPMRINLESRLRLIDDEIAGLGLHEDIRARARAVLTFGGKPVVDEGVIEASFGAEALQAFQRLVSTTAATREGRTLGARGRIPDEEEYRLFITGTFVLIVSVERAAKEQRTYYLTRVEPLAEEEASHTR